MRGLNEIRKLNRRACVHCRDDRFFSSGAESGSDCYNCKGFVEPDNVRNRLSHALRMAEAEKEVLR